MQDGNPIPYMIKAVSLSKDQPYKQVFNDKEVYISRSKKYDNKIEDTLIKLIEKEYKVTKN